MSRTSGRVAVADEAPLVTPDGRSTARDRLCFAARPLVLLVGVAAASLFVAGCRDPSPTAVHVFAAASLRGPLEEIVAGSGGARSTSILLNFASSGALARQIQLGAPAVVFVSADPQWIDALGREGLADTATRVAIARNRLVFVARGGGDGAARRIDVQRDFDIEGALGGKFAIGDPRLVPAGRYAKQVLKALGWWSRVRDSIVTALDARAVLTLVETEVCSLGIVYASDAAASRRTREVAQIPERLHDAVIYEAVLVSDNSGAAASEFLKSLSSQAAADTFEKHGFLRPAGNG